jgi:chemotaxis protein MotB
MSADGSDLRKTLAQELGKLPNHVAIEGHTDAKPYPPTAAYTNWELSASRANAARRLMKQSGFREDQVTQIRGFADQRLRKPDAPLDPLNPRISLIAQYQEKATGGTEANSAGASGEKSAPGQAKQESTGGNEPAAPKKE